MASDQSSIVDTRGDRVMTMLRERALGAMARAYAPYSQFRVGAALLGADGSVTEGCNVENASFPAGICAERSAVAAAVARGIRSFDSITIATEA
ncbi:MAG: cytidine deaminase, partial [Gemmatimonadetes bacterium]